LSRPIKITAFLELKIFKASENQTITSVMEDKLKEMGVEFDSRNLKNLLTPAKIGSYAGVSYTANVGEETIEITAFESADKNFVGRIVFYPASLSDGDKSGLTEGILETFKFSGEESPSPFSSPVSSSSSRFRIEE